MPMLPEPLHIVGAGPVGSLLACLLGQSGARVTVWEKRTALPDSSMAIGITPPSLEILDGLGIGDAFREHGVFIHKARVFEEKQECGVLDFGSPEQAILSLPQATTLTLLRNAFASFPTVEFREGDAFPGIDEVSDAGWVLACDGAKSSMRDQAGIPFSTHAYRTGFVMADFPDEEALGPDARLYFSAHGAVESFPLPDQQRRWIAQVPPQQPASLDTLHTRVRENTGIDLAGRPHSTLWPFTPSWGLARTYANGKAILCGDAAHIMSPIGGQGMNTGFADALMLFQVLHASSPEALQAYTRMRKRVFRMSARRAAWGMYLGTRQGKGWSVLRRHLIRALLNTDFTHRVLARTFSMRNLPQTSLS